MQKPEVNFYPIIDLLDVEKYLSDLYGEEVDLLIALFGDDVSNDIYKDYLVEEPPHEYHIPEGESIKEWQQVERFEKYLWENFRAFSKVVVRICW